MVGRSGEAFGYWRPKGGFAVEGRIMEEIASSDLCAGRNNISEGF